MKIYLKAMIPATGMSLMLVGLTILMQFMFYGMEAFGDFFGVAVGKFNLLHYIIYFLLLLTFFTLYFKSDYEEV